MSCRSIWSSSALILDIQWFYKISFFLLLRKVFVSSTKNDPFRWDTASNTKVVNPIWDWQRDAFLISVLPPHFLLPFYHTWGQWMSLKYINPIALMFCFVYELANILSVQAGPVCGLPSSSHFSPFRSYTMFMFTVHLFFLYRFFSDTWYDWFVFYCIICAQVS